MILKTADTEMLAGFLSTDPSLYAYALGDLDPFFFDATQWWVTQRADDVTAVLLLYTAFETAVVHGVTDNIDQGVLWGDRLEHLPRQAFIHYRQPHEEIIARRYRIESHGPHRRMQWNPEAVRYDIGQIPMQQVRMLTPDDVSAIHELYNAAYPGAFFDRRTLEIGRTAGMFAGERLVAIAACHVYSPTQSVAAIGAVATHPDFRGRGFCTATTWKLVELLQDDVATICLNVSCGNAAAIKVYERLGFEMRHEYVEAFIEAM